jgi:Mlc titration factor MtfA (ptsG expression regulator)
MLPLLFLLLLMVAVLAWQLREPLFAGWRRRRVTRQPFPAPWRQILRQRVPAVHRLPVDLQLQLKKRMQVFLAEKPFIGCGGLAVTEEMRVVVAAQACLLLLNRPRDDFHALRQILLYPGAFVVDKLHTDATGVLQEQRQVLLGESWQQGQVILSWPDVLEGAAVPDDGRNVVVHEFAHQLDQQAGRANGAPAGLFGRQRRARWARVMNAEYTALRRRVQRGEPSLLSDYAATDPAEFFAVASEVFFEQPLALAEAHPALFGELRGYYRINPLSW